jgi:hypothetical protein
VIRTLPKFVAAVSLIGFCLIGHRAEARTFGEFLKALGNSIAHPQPHAPPRKRDRSEVDNTATKDTTALPSPGASVTPPQIMVRAAATAPENKGKARDVPYGIPVPSKQGFVTSPFAPNEGLVDVRGFPSGTEVKDPYTGKIFLTP